LHKRKQKRDRHLWMSSFKSHKRFVKIRLRKKKIRRFCEGVSKQVAKDSQLRSQILKSYEVIKAPKIFSLKENSIGFVNFAEKCELARKKRMKRGIAFDLRAVEKLDFSAIALLISLVYKLKLHKIEFNGINPVKKELCDLLNYYNFFQQIGIKPSYENIHFQLGKKGDKITIKGDQIVKAELGLEIATYVSEKLFERSNKVNDGLQTLFLELMANTTKWSQQENEKNLWLLVMSYDRVEKKIDFQFIDFGIGIFESLKQSKTYKNWYSSIVGFFSSNEKILESYQSSHLDHHQNYSLSNF
jgi:ABC-type transporter Mla MlaB component